VILEGQGNTENDSYHILHVSPFSPVPSITFHFVNFIMPYYRRTYSYKKPAYKARTYKKYYFPRKTFNGIQSYKPTGNMFKSIFNLSAAHATTFNSSFILDPLYIMYNDARFATWRSMYDEYRMCKV